MKLIDKEKIREEVARLKEETSIGLSEHENGVEQGRMEIINAIILFLDSLQEEPVSEGSDVAAQEYVTKEGYLAGLHYNSMVRSFKAGAEWYASHNTKLPDNLLLAARKASIDMCNIDEKYLDEYPYNPIAEQKFIEGAKWQKERMIAKAIDGIARPDDSEIWCDLKSFNFKDGDKCKVIVIKED